jgi:hypothetical protein
MNLLTTAVSEGYKLTPPQKNLLLKLEILDVSVDMNETGVATNPISGYSNDVGALLATLIGWVYAVSYYQTTTVSVGTFDRVRYLILSLNPQAYSEFID